MSGTTRNYSIGGEILLPVYISYQWSLLFILLLLVNIHPMLSGIAVVDSNFVCFHHMDRRIEDREIEG